MYHSIHRVCWILLLLVGISPGCSPSLEHQFANNSWLWKDTLHLNFENNQVGQLYVPVLRTEVDHTYDFKNFYIKYRIISPNKDTLSGVKNFLLSDSVGNWLTTKRPGRGRYYFELPLTPPGKLAYTGNYRIDLVQYMRTDTLIGIRQAELAFQKVMPD
jgi:gliding motility-associated lipoprotein GldH